MRPDGHAVLCGQREFKDMMARVPAAVAVVTAVVESEPVGLTATSVCSVSVHPATLMVAIDHESRSVHAFRNADRVTVSFLSTGQEDLAALFATRGSDKFAATGIETRGALPPRVLGSLAVADCRRYMSHDIAGHLLLFLQVESAETGKGAPLVWVDRGFAGIASGAHDASEAPSDGDGAENRGISMNGRGCTANEQCS